MAWERSLAQNLEDAVEQLLNEGAPMYEANADNDPCVYCGEGMAGAGLGGFRHGFNCPWDRLLRVYEALLASRKSGL